MSGLLRRVGFSVAAPLVAMLIAVAATTLVISASGSQSGAGDFWSILLRKPGDRLMVNIVDQSAMIYLAAVAAAIGFRMGLFNIGVEGQYTVASYAAAVFAGSALLPGPLNVAVALLVGHDRRRGAAWAGLAAVLRRGGCCGGPASGCDCGRAARARSRRSRSGSASTSTSTSR